MLLTPPLTPSSSCSLRKKGEEQSAARVSSETPMPRGSPCFPRISRASFTVAFHLLQVPRREPLYETASSTHWFVHRRHLFPQSGGVPKLILPARRHPLCSVSFLSSGQKKPGGLPGLFLPPLSLTTVVATWLSGRVPHVALPLISRPLQATNHVFFFLSPFRQSRPV